MDKLPIELIRALELAKREAIELRDRAEAAIETASKWLANEPARDFSLTGNYASAAGDLEAAVAKVRAYRDVAYKLNAYDEKEE